MGGTAEAVDAQSAALGQVGEAQGAVPDDPGAEERRGGDVVESLGDEVGVGLVDENEFGVAAVEVPTGEARSEAEVLPPRDAEAAPPARGGEPRHADALSFPPACAARPDGVDDAHDLVARRDQVATRREIALGQMQVGSAHPAGEDPDADLAGSGLGHRPPEPEKRRSIHRSGAVDGPRRHGRGRHTHA